jgi:hypothetical protein
MRDPATPVISDEDAIEAVRQFLAPFITPPAPTFFANPDGKPPYVPFHTWDADANETALALCAAMDSKPRWVKRG